MKLKHRADLPTTSSNEKRSVKIDGQPTSVSLEDAFWHALKEIAAKQNIAVQDLVLKIDKGRTHGIYHQRSACTFSATTTIAMITKPRQPAGPAMTLGNMRARFALWLAAICVAAIMTGCAATIDDNILSPYSEPGRYDFLDCSTISKTIAKVSYTEKQLAQLMTRASEAADGAIVKCYGVSRPIQHRARRVASIAQGGRSQKMFAIGPEPAADRAPGLR